MTRATDPLDPPTAQSVTLMNPHEIDRLAAELHAALRHCKPVSPLTDRVPGISIADGYAISQRLLSIRLEEGERVIGKKIGITSAAIQDVLNVRQPDFGYLTDAMAWSTGATLPLANRLIQPRAEGEIAFVLKRDLEGPGVTNADVLRATEGVMACFEIVDSRIEDWKIRIEDTVADNASSGMFVLGERMVDPAAVDLAMCAMVIEKNGHVATTGAGAAALGSPVSAVAWLANTLGRLDTSLRAGEIILSGSLGALVHFGSADHLRLRIGGIGEVSFFVS
jgi:2-oxopent-4-enoate/cis-2-oxohex-4-enoate hydratase